MNSLVKIMLVEDDKNIREIAARILVKLNGMQILSCACGKEALDNVVAFAPQLILLDMMMPEMDGFTTIKEIRKIKAVKNIPIIIMSARVQLKQVEEYLKAGVMGVIAKPFDPMTLGTMINKIWLEHHTKTSEKEVHSQTKLSVKDQQALDDLYQEFSKDLPSHLLRIRERWDYVKLREWDPTDWSDLYMQVHKLCGSTGTFGFHKLSQVLIKIEMILNPLQNNKPSLKSLEEIDELMNAVALTAHMNVNS